MDHRRAILINATNVGRDINGIGRYSLSLARYLLDNWDYPFRIYFNNEARGHLQGVKDSSKVRFVSGSMSPDHGFRGHFLRLLWTNTLGFRNRRALLFNTSQLEGSLHHAGQIITVHDLIPLLSYPKYLKKQFFYFKYVLPLVLKNSERIIADSHYIKKSILEHYNVPDEKITVIHAGIDSRFLSCEKTHQKKAYMLYVGRMSPTKNIAGLIKAFEILTTVHNVDITLKITGTYDELYFRISPAIRERIDFLGNVPDHELPALYGNALLFAFPSFYEGFGIPPLEAMACGCPTVVSNAASLPEVCGDAAYYVDPTDVDSIAQGMLKVATDTALRNSLIQKGAERAALYSWDRCGREHVKVFEEVLNL